MSGKVIDLDPTKRLTKEALDRIKETVSKFNPDSTEQFVILFTDENGVAQFEAFGVNWALMGIAQAYLEELRCRLLHDSVEGDDD